MPTRWYQAEVIDIVESNPGVRQFFLRAPDDFPGYKSGQFITLDLPVGDKRLQRWKSYSIANAPDDSGLIELCIVRHPDGLGTTYLFDKITVGDSLSFKGPEGNFVLPTDIKNIQLVMVCTGTGIAPFRAMIQSILRLELPVQNIHLIFGARREEDILYRSEMEQLAASYPWFQYDVCLSRDENWKGYKGHVHRIYLEKYKVINPQHVFYLCGWTKMIDEAVENLVLKMGYSRNQVKYELYG